MATLYLKEQGTRLGKKDERLIVRRGAEQVEDIPVIKVDRVMVMGWGVQVSTAALHFLAQRKIPVVFTNTAGTKIGPTLTMGLGDNGALRLAQLRVVDSAARALPLVQAIVAGKLANQHTLLTRYGTEWGGIGGRAKATIQQSQTRVGQTTDADQARGHEGVGAAAYWAAWVAVLQRPWGFAKRAYYPPPDPLNALLSFGYTVLLNEVLGVVQSKGLDPFLGFFHTVQHGRPSLALDLEEEFRAVVVDATVLDLLDAHAVTPADFTQPADKPGAVYAGEGARKRFVAAYEARLQTRMRYSPTGTQETLRRCVGLQVDHLARVLLGEDAAYQPFVWN